MWRAHFCGTTALFLAMTLAALWHLRWMRRLPALETLTTATGPALASLRTCSLLGGHRGAGREIRMKEPSAG